MTDSLADFATPPVFATSAGRLNEVRYKKALVVDLKLNVNRKSTQQHTVRVCHLFAGT